MKQKDACKPNTKQKVGRMQMSADCPAWKWGHVVMMY